jgi:RNA polymerase sigma factor (sigma-70 family)
MSTPDDTISPDDLLSELGWVKALAHRLVLDPNVADDILQRVCLRALERPPRDVSGVAGLRRWLSTLTRRLARHSQRSESRRTRRERVAAAHEATPSTVDLSARREVLRSVVKAVTELKERDFTVLSQRYFDGLSMAELADLHGVSSETVRQRLLRARRRLRSQLEGGMGSDRERWLLALGPLGAPAAVARELSLTTLWNQTGAALMSKAVPSVILKSVLGVGFVSLAALTAWQVLDEPVLSDEGEARQSPMSPFHGRAVSSKGASERENELPVAAPAQARRARDLSATDALAASLANSPGVSPVDEADEAGQDEPSLFNLDLESFASDSPDLVALNQFIRNLARGASVLEETVSVDPSDGSVQGWIALQGTELLAKFRVGADGAYRVELDGGPEFELPEAYIGLSMRFDFLNDAGRAADVGSQLQLHPNTSSEAFPGLLASLGGREHVTGWHLQIGYDGTVGRPMVMRADENAVIVTVTGGEPGLNEHWANDTSPYDLWLALLLGRAP